MATTRKVSHVLRKADNTAWSSATVTFTPTPGLFDGAFLYPETPVTVVSGGSGQVDAYLVPGAYTVLLPNGEQLRIVVPEGVDDLQLTALLVGNGPVVMDDERWAAYKEAVREYSHYRPRVVPSTLTLTAGQKQHALPVGVTSVVMAAYGEPFAIQEVWTSEGLEQGWATLPGYLYVTPAPDTDTAIAVIYKMVHTLDEATRTSATVPAADAHLLETLTDANLMIEQQSAVNLGLASYTLGSTTVKWAQEAGGSPNSLGEGQKLKARILSALQEPLAVWA